MAALHGIPLRASNRTLQFHFANGGTACPIQEVRWSLRARSIAVGSRQFPCIIDLNEPWTVIPWQHKNAFESRLIQGLLPTGEDSRAIQYWCRGSGRPVRCRFAVVNVYLLGETAGDQPLAIRSQPHAIVARILDEPCDDDLVGKGIALLGMDIVRASHGIEIDHSNLPDLYWLKFPAVETLGKTNPA